MDLDPYVVDVLMPDLVGHDRQPSAFLVYLFLSRRASEGGVELTLRQIAEGTGLSKRAVQSAIARLEARALLEVRRGGITQPARYRPLRPWRRTRGRP
ncbi:MAG: helix-turn-helix domain-containing protein [Gemmatimonadetes bacterium]|nr:MAG: helix-turn-helix domain-containing protein [Gemmatimonadota bacterium]